MMKSCKYKPICIHRRKVINYKEGDRIYTDELSSEHDTCSKCHDQCNFELDRYRFRILDEYYKNHPNYEEMKKFGIEYSNKGENDLISRQEVISKAELIIDEDGSIIECIRLKNITHLPSIKLDEENIDIDID